MWASAPAHLTLSDPLDTRARVHRGGPRRTRRPTVPSRPASLSVSRAECDRACHESRCIDTCVLLQLGGAVGEGRLVRVRLALGSTWSCGVRFGLSRLGRGKGMPI